VVSAVTNIVAASAAFSAAASDGSEFRPVSLFLVYSPVDLVHLALLGVATRSLRAGRQKSVRSVLRGALAGTLPLSPPSTANSRDALLGTLVFPVAV
jgi:hypothetical protein